MGQRSREGVSVAVIGTGFGGLAAAIELKRRGHRDVVLLEKADDVGGVWRENTYPGAACDVPSPFYSFSYEPNPRWPHRFSRQPAILDYLRDVADKYDVRRHIRFGVEVTEARYDETARSWQVHLDSGETLEVDVLVSAVGQLSRPAFPDIPGREDFAGPSFHSAQWCHDVDLTGRRVAVIGTGASAVQFVPAIVDDVAHLTLFQRSAPHLLLRPDTQFGALHHKIFERLPLTQKVERATWYGMVEVLSIAWVYSRLIALVLTFCSRLHMKWGARAKPGLFEQIWPDYPIGCKRVLFSNDYVPALAREHVDVVTDRIVRITAHGVVSADASGVETEHEVDVVIWGTGFKATEFLAPMRIVGMDGRDLHHEWATGAHAYFGMTVAGFPNFHVMYGPNTNTGGGSIIYFLEVQARYLGAYVDEIARRRTPLDLRASVGSEHDTRIQELLADSVWTRCDSWYRIGGTGRITTNWPLLGIQYAQQAKFDADDYEEATR